jgi:threonylcarbamoyladenosine tRNA methylthiotransferase MtaB
LSLILKNETIEFRKTELCAFSYPWEVEILKLMKRRYQREIYTERVNKIREVMPHACIGVDVIVGFPGETDEHFLGTIVI